MNNRIASAKKAIPVVNNWDIYNRYLAEISNYKVLTSIEEKELFVRLKNGDKSVTEIIIKHNLKFVISVAKSFMVAISASTLTLEDLVGEGNVGLVMAVETFDPNRGFKFITHAVWYIRQAILNSIRTNIRGIRIPDNRQSVLFKLKIIESKLEQKFGRELTDVELFEATRDSGLYNGMHGPEYITELKAGSIFEKSLTEPLATFHDTDSTLIDVLTNENADDAHGLIVANERTKFLDDILSKNTPAHVKNYFVMYYGLDGNEPMTHAEIGKTVGLSDSSIGFAMKIHTKRLNGAHRKKYKELIEE